MVGKTYYYSYIHYKLSALYREHTALQNNTSLHFFIVKFCPPGSGSAFPMRIRIRIQPFKFNTDPCGSGSTTLVLSIKNLAVEKSREPEFSVTVMEFNGQRTRRKKPSMRYTQINWVWSSSAGFAPVCRAVGPGFDSLPYTLRRLFAEVKH
jgi:hypothetical protein